MPARFMLWNQGPSCVIRARIVSVFTIVLIVQQCTYLCATRVQSVRGANACVVIPYGRMVARNVREHTPRIFPEIRSRFVGECPVPQSTRNTKVSTFSVPTYAPMTPRGQSLASRCDHAHPHHRRCRFH